MSPNDPAEYLQSANRVRYIVDRTTELTALNAVAAKAIQLAEDERTAAMDLATVISSDQALTAKLLRLSNSAYYGYARRISTVREAVILLGMRTVRSVAIASGIIDVFKLPEAGLDFDCDLFWAHSVTVGLVAEAIARETKLARPEDAFTAGVVHDIGKLAMVLVEPELFGKAIKLVTVEELPYGEAEARVFGVSHAQVGARLAQHWKFPEALVEAIHAHHPAMPISRIDSLASIVASANLACNREGMACGFDWVGDECRRPVETLAPQVDVALSRVHGGMRTLEEKSQAFLKHVTAQAPRWYALPGMHAADEPPTAEVA